MKTNNEQLTLQQQRFCDEYLVSFNAFQSARKAGYSEHTARKCELLHLPKVQAYLQTGMKRTSERLEISHDMILRELAKVAFANMGDYYDENAVLKPMNELTPDQKAAICHYQLIDCVGEYGERAGKLSKIKLHNKMSALDKIARHTGFYAASGKKKDSCVLPVTGCGEEAVAETELQPVTKVEGTEETPAAGGGVVGDNINNGGVDENILTLSHPVGMEDGRGKMEDGIENILTLSPLVEQGTKSKEQREENEVGLTISSLWVRESGNRVAISH
jgi:phage terminase small subunit